MERTARLKADDALPDCSGKLYDARDVNCTACAHSTICMYDFYMHVLRPQIDKLGSEKPYLDLVDFDAIPVAEVQAMLDTGMSDDTIEQEIMLRCACNAYLAKHRLKILKALIAYESTIS